MSIKSTDLLRTLGLKLAIVVVIGNILGSGVYKKVAPMAAEVDSAALVLFCWVLGGIVTLIGALCSAELAGMLADTGGEFVYFKKIYNRFFAFLYGWSCFTAIKTTTTSALAYVFAQSIHAISPLPELVSSLADVSIFGIFYPFAGFNVKATAILTIVLLTFFNTRGIRIGVGLSSVLLGMVVGGILLIVIFGLSSNEANASAVINDFGTSPFQLSAVFTAMLSAFWAYEGWNSVGFVAGEIKDPNRNVPLSLSIGVLVVIVLYLLANTTYLSLLSIPELKSIFQSENQIAAVEAVRVFGGSVGALVISILILITTLGCLHASIISNPRIYYAMAKEGLFFLETARVNKFNVPARALWFHGVWASLLILSGTFDQLTEMMIFAAFIFYGASAFGVIVLRKRMPEVHRPYKVWGYPILPGLFVLFCAVLIVNTIISRPREAGIGIVLILIGVPFYFYFARKSGLSGSARK